jgi:polysaccharide biosynthesis/export protein
MIDRRYKSEARDGWFMADHSRVSAIGALTMSLSQGRNVGEAMKNLLDFVSRASGRALLFATAFIVCACSSTGSRPPPAPVSAATQDYSYIVGPGDNINIIVWRNPELSMSVPVRPDGKVSTPLIDELVAQGKNSIQIAREIEKLLGKYVRDPVVTVIVTGFVGPYDQQIRVVGEAARPQFLPYKQQMTLLDVMIAVGGLTDFAAGNNATILRSGSGSGNQQYSVRLKDLIKRGDISANVEMRPGDILIIPQSFF